MGTSSNGILCGMNLLSLGTTAAYFGRFDEALEALSAAKQVLGDGTPVATRVKAQIALGYLWLSLGACDEARKAMAPLTADVPPAMQVQWHWTQARINRMGGGSDEFHLRCMSELQAANAGLTVVQSDWLEWSRQGDAQPVIERLRRVQRECEQLAMPGTARAMLLRRIDRLVEAGGDAGFHLAGELAAELLAGMAPGMHGTIYRPVTLWTLGRVFRNSGQEPKAGHCVDEARRQIEASVRDHVPPAYRGSFLTRNPINRLAMQQGSPVTP